MHEVPWPIAQTFMVICDMQYRSLVIPLLKKITTRRGEKPLRAEERTKPLNPHVTPGIVLGKANPLTTPSTLLRRKPRGRYKRPRATRSCWVLFQLYSFFLNSLFAWLNALLNCFIKMTRKIGCITGGIQKLRLINHSFILMVILHPYGNLPYQPR